MAAWSLELRHVIAAREIQSRPSSARSTATDPTW